MSKKAKIVSVVDVALKKINDAFHEAVENLDRTNYREVLELFIEDLYSRTEALDMEEDEEEDDKAAG